MGTKKVIVGMSTCGLSAGSQKTYARFGELLAAEPGTFELASAGCIGMCYREPLVEVRDGERRVVYGGVTPELAERIFREDVRGGRVLEEHVALRLEPGRGAGGSEAPRQEPQVRIVLRNCGLIDPESIDQYEGAGGYGALRKALFGMKPEEIIKEVKDSGLRGRGGAGFPTGLKWSFAASQKAEPKYIVCNADEGDPGAFMDRSVLEGDPHSVIEGMIIAARAIGGHKGYIYCRAEYPMAIKRLTIALDAARGKGYLGGDILGSGFGFDIDDQAGRRRVRLRRGDGALPVDRGQARHAAHPASLPGGEGALAEAHEQQQRRDVRERPVDPLERRRGVRGLRHREEPGDEGVRPRRQGRLRRARRGPDGPPHQRPRLQDRRRHQGRPQVQGGADGGAVRRLHPGVAGAHPGRFRVDPRDGRHHGLGRHGRHGRPDVHGGDGALLPRLHPERVVRQVHLLPRRHAPDARDPHPDHAGGGGPGGHREAENASGSRIKEASLCGLGQTAPNPVLTTLRYFPEEYEAHIRDKRCPAASCTALVDFCIDPAKCTGCTLCVKSCPVGAIAGERKSAHTVDTAKCVKCGKCITVCTFGAVYKK